MAQNRDMHVEHKYARIEWERRFLLDGFPSGAQVTRARHIRDRYIVGTTLRLREVTESERDTVFKLTQKLPERNSGTRRGLITSMYLTRDEFLLLAMLPGRELTKTRYSVPPFGIDVFEGELNGLVLAEAEFASAEEAMRLTLPPFAVHEVTEDFRFTGGSLVSAKRQELQDWLQEYGITVHDVSGVESV